MSDYVRTDKQLIVGMLGSGLNHLDFVASKLDRDNWKDIGETEIRIFTEVKLNTFTQPK